MPARLAPMLALTALTLALAALTAAPARADESTDGGRSPFELHLAIDIPVTLGSAMLGIVPELLDDELPGPWCGLACERDSVNALDRTVIGNRSATAATISDAGFWLSLTLPHAAGALDVLVSDPRDGWAGYARDTVVLLETAAVTAALSNLFKLAVPRPRPLVYDPQRPAEERTASDASRSFYSAHTSLTFSMATAYSYLFTRRHPESPLVIPVWLGTHAIAATTGYMRVAAGKHFWTDVIVGATVGAGLGLLVPWLHTLAPEDGAAGGGPRLSVSPTVGPGGSVGAVLTVW